MCRSVWINIAIFKFRNSQQPQSRVLNRDVTIMKKIAVTRSFNFKVVPKEEGRRIPVSVAGKVMVDVQSLLSHIGEHLIAKELNMLTDVPDEWMFRFQLCVDNGSGTSISSSVDIGDDYSGALMKSAIELLETTLDTVGGSAMGDWIYDNYPDPKYRKMILKDLLDLSEDTTGFVLMYGSDNESKEFAGIGRNKISVFIDEDTRSFPGTIEGALCRARTSDNNPSIYLSCGNIYVPVVFSGTISETDALPYCTRGPCRIKGTLVYSDDGLLTEIRNVSEMEDFPFVLFFRIITADRDMLLNNPLTANIDYDRDSRTWTLSSELLEISVSKQDWDIAVSEFHDYFMFLWEIYAEKSEERLGDEEVRIKEYLLSLIPSL